MANKIDREDRKMAREDGLETSPPPPGYIDDQVSVQTDQAFIYDDSQKLGYTGTVFVILNKMIGTGSKLSMSSSCKPWTNISQYSLPPLASSLLQAQSVSHFSSGSSVESSLSLAFQSSSNLLLPSRAPAERRTT